MNNTEINQLIVATALRKMFTGGYFDICTLDKCIELMGFVKGNGGQSYDRLRTLHCIHFKDMPAEIAERLPVWIGDCMNGTSIDKLVRGVKASERTQWRTPAEALTVIGGDVARGEAEGDKE